MKKGRFLCRIGFCFAVLVLPGLTSCALLYRADTHSAEELYVAVTNGNAQAVDQLLKESPRLVNTRVGGGTTPLVAAVTRERRDIVAVLLAGKADVNMPVGGMSPLHVAVFKGNAEIAELLIEYGADVEGSVTGLTPLHVAAREGNLAVAKVLLDHKAGINSRYSGLTPLTLAIQNKRYAMEVFLRQRGGVE